MTDVSLSDAISGALMDAFDRSDFMLYLGAGDEQAVNWAIEHLLEETDEEDEVRAGITGIIMGRALCQWSIASECAEYIIDRAGLELS